MRDSVVRPSSFVLRRSPVGLWLSGGRPRPALTKWGLAASGFSRA
jgi:hypothetical protein